MALHKAKFGDYGLIVTMEERLDINTAVEFGYEVNDAIDDNDIKHLVLDCKDLVYISSIGLRVLLELQKRMNQEGSMQLKNVSSDVLSIFKMTGFEKIVKIV